jgi:long-chain fatty acid transport protein
MFWPAVEAEAGGLYVTDFGTASMGTASAGANAKADDASTVLHNAAGMTRLDDHQLSLGLAPGWATVKFDSDLPGSNGGDQGGLVPITSLAYVHKLSDDWRLGIGVVSLSGAALDPDDDWVGRHQITKLSLLTVTASPSVAYRFNDWLSVAAGPLFTYGVMDWDLAAPSPVPGGDDVKVSIDDADDFAVSAKAGALIEFSETLRLGIVYISETELELSGDVGIPAGVDASFDLDLPLAQMVRTSLYADSGEKLSVMFSLAWEDWSTLETTPLSIASGSADVPIGFHDTWRVAFGFHYKYTDTLTLQTGISYDSSAVDDDDRITALPVDRQIRFAVGALHDYSDDIRMAFAFEWLNLGDGRVEWPNVQGDYSRNDIFFLSFNTTWKKLPWSGRGGFGASDASEGDES